MKPHVLPLALFWVFLAPPGFAAEQQEQDQFPQWTLMSGKAQGQDLVNVCLFRDKTTVGLFSRGEWKTQIGNGQEPCEEKLIADLDKRRLYFDFTPGSPTYSPRGYFASAGQEGRADVHCSRFTQERGYSPCSSNFFSVPEPGMESYRILTAAFKRIVRYEAKAIAALENLITEREAAKAVEKYAVYIKAYESLRSLDDIGNFERRYVNDDPDNLIQKLRPLKMQLQLQVYRDQFASAKTSEELRLFIGNYELKDPDGLIPEARRRLAAAIKTEQIEQERLNRERLAENKRKELDGLATRVLSCNQQIRDAYRAIDREREVARVSGYENKLLLHQAGEIIVECRGSIARDYDSYRKKGGMKRLDELK